MAKGYPDFFGMTLYPQVRIFTQITLTDKVIATGAIDFAYKATGIGISYDGFVIIDCAGDPDGLTIQVVLDGVGIASLTLTDLLNNTMTHDDDYPFVLKQYNKGTGQYGISLKGGLNFSSYYWVQCWNTSGNDATLNGRFYWYEVTR